MNLDSLTPYISDVTNTWQALLISVASAIVLAFVFLILVYCCAAPIMWISIFGVIGASGFFGWYYWDRASDFADRSDNSENWYKAIGVLLWITCGIIFILCCCCYDKIRVALAVITAAAHFVMNTKRILFHPLLLALCFVLWFAVWLVGAVYIFSVGTITKHPSYPIAEVDWDETTRYVVIYFIFGLLWVNAFFIAMFQFTIAVAAATWYFSYGTDHSGAKICKGICWGMGYHAGSLAFGSFLLALIWMIQLVFEYWRKKMESMNAGENKCMKCMICCIRCCLDCLNRCIKFVTKNAYIQIALTSKSFCFAAIDAFFLILRNVMRFGITHAIAWIFLLLGKAVIAGGATFIGYLCVEYWLEKEVDLNNSFVPLIVFFVATYVIATVFLNVYSMGADTILQCFLLDEELNRGAGGANARPPAMKGLVKELKKK